MRQIKFFLGRVISIDYKTMWKTAKKLGKINNKSTLLVFIDIAYCGLIYQTGYIDYFCMDFINLNKTQRKTFLTRGSNNDLIAKYNTRKYRSTFDDKVAFNKKFDKYLKRDWLYIDNNKSEFKKFLKDKKQIIAKLINESGGVGVEKISTEAYKTINDLYDYLLKSKHLLVEEVVVQHCNLAKLHPKSVNTLRIITLLIDKKVNIVTSYLRMGNGQIIDNSSGGGILSKINKKTGIVEFPASDGDLNTYIKHPITKEQIQGFQIPFYKETIKLVKEVAKIEPMLKYIGWDIAITDKGPLIIEGNPYPSYTYYQLPIHTPSKEGLLKVINDIERGVNE